MKKICSECNIRLCDYNDGYWTEWICWKCGNYESNTPAFKSNPQLFTDMFRNNPELFMKKIHSKASPTENQQRNKTPDDETEPFFSKMRFFY